MNPRPEEFNKFYNPLMKNAPDGYQAWLFPLQKQGKAPDGRAIAQRAPPGYERETGEKAGSWKAPHAQLTKEESIELMCRGHNIGIAGRSNDPLINVDVDRGGIELKETLTVKSRSRIGEHGFYFSGGDDKLPNIPTEQGEVRSRDQYVVAAGSYVPTTEKELTDKVLKGEITEETKTKILNDSYIGHYTVSKAIPPTTITFDELPDMFKEQVRKNEEKQKEIEKQRQEMLQYKPATPVSSSGRRSALFDLRIEDVVPPGLSDRDAHPLHDSDTGQNFSVSDGVSHCWRHNVSLNPLQYLVVKSGYMSCLDAGTGHKGSNAGASQVTGSDETVFHAWLQAKRDGIIPIDDPIPTYAVLFIARKHNVCPHHKIPNRWEYPKKKLPIKAYNKCLEIVEKEY